MKRCPECRRDYFDDSLSYCLDDGSHLVNGPVGIGAIEPPTQVFANLVSGEQPANSIAVLPFANVSPDPDNEYFCDGLAEEILNALAHVERLKVAARTSAFSFKRRSSSVGEVAAALNVRTVLEGKC
jgi:TolB-like protein